MYRGLLGEVSRNELELPDRDFDTGAMTSPTEYRLADAAYARLAVKLADRDPASIDPKLRENVLSFYRNLDLPFDTKKHAAEWNKTLAAIDKLKKQTATAARRADQIPASFRAFSKDIQQHFFRQFTCARILLARVIGTEENRLSRRRAELLVVRETECRAALDDAPGFENVEVGIEGDLPQGDDNAWLKEVQFPLQIGTAVMDLLEGGFVVRRGAMRGTGDVEIAQSQAIVA